MNPTKAILCCASLIVSTISLADAVPSLRIDSVRQIDEYGDLLWQDERPRLDNLFIELREGEPNTIAYILVYAGRRTSQGVAQARARRARNYLVNERGIQTERVVTIDGGHREDLTTELFLFRRDIEPPTPTPTVDQREIRVRVCRANSRHRQSRRRLSRP